MVSAAAISVGCGSNANSNGTGGQSGSGGNSSVGGSGGGGTGGSQGTCYGDKPGCALPTSVKRDTSPKVSDADQKTFANDNEAFALAFEQQIEDAKANVIFSPYSISTALGMSYAGARNDTAKAIAAAMHFELPEAQLAAAFDALDLQLAQRAQGDSSVKGGGFRLHAANAFWKQVGYQILQPFVDELQRDYGTNMWVADFSDPNAASLIDKWVSAETQGKIPNLLSPGDVDANTKLVLVNAIYFSAAWATPFDKSTTKAGTFHANDGTSVSAQMMEGWAGDEYAQTDAYEAVDVPYAGTPLSMTIVMPKSGTADAFASTLDAKTLDAIVDALQYMQVDTTMPKFSFATGGQIDEPLKSMGMGPAFCDEDAPCNADFTGIVPKGTPMGIQHVIHKAQIDVDESGTQASAATAVVMAVGSDSSSGPPQTASIVLDHPFFFFIRDLPTNTILFAGRVNDPTQ